MMKTTSKIKKNKKCRVYGVRLDIEIKFEILDAMYFKHKMIYNRSHTNVIIKSKTA